MEDYIAVLGDINADITGYVKRLPKTGESVTGYEIGAYPGGKGANQADQCAKMGIKTYMLGKTGADFQGTAVLKSLCDDGVDCSFVKTAEGEKTGCALINIDEDGKNTLVYAPGANEKITKGDIDEVRDIITGAKIFITQNAINPDVTAYALKTAREAGVTTIFNPAPAGGLPEGIFKSVDYITPNETESEQYTGFCRTDYPAEEWRARTADWFLQKGVKRVCITLGSRGVFYADDSCRMVVPAFSVKAADTTAAGDSFHGGFAYGLFCGYPLKKALQIGCACGGMTAMGKGAQISIRRLEDIAAFLKENGIDI